MSSARRRVAGAALLWSWGAISKVKGSEARYCQVAATWRCHWSVLAGPNLPAFLYILEWADAAERQSCWQNFYDDDRWWQIRSRSNAGSELVESYGLWLMQRNGEKRNPIFPLSVPREGEI